MVQETFLKLILSEKSFESTEHEKAWLIVTASNTCKDALKDWRRKSENIEDYQEVANITDDGDNSIMEAVFSLPAKYKDVVYLYYYEGYKTYEIAKLLHCSDSAIRSRLSRARRLLKKNLGGGQSDGKRNYGFL